MTSQNLNSWETENLSLLLKPGSNFSNTQHKLVLPTNEAVLPSHPLSLSEGGITFMSRSILAFSHANSTCIGAPIQFTWSCTNICPAQRDAEPINHICFSSYSGSKMIHEVMAYIYR